MVCKNISIDYGIMEKAENVHVIPSDFGWSDLGTWTSVHANSEKDYHENAVQGNAIVYESYNNMVKTTREGKLVVLKGLEGYIVVDTEDALLICKKRRRAVHQGNRRKPESQSRKLRLIVARKVYP